MEGTIMDRRIEEARSRMVRGFDDFCTGFTDFLTLSFQNIAKTLSSIDWSGLASLREADPDRFNWTASGPIRRVQLRRARAMLLGPDERKHI